MVYNTTFTMAAGGITVTFTLRPENVSTNPRINVAEYDIPGSNHSVLQHVGSQSQKINFQFPLWKLAYVGITAGIDPQDVYEQLRTWGIDGTTVLFISDFVEGVLGQPTGINVLITDLNCTEIPGPRFNYVVTLELTEYWS